MNLIKNKFNNIYNKYNNKKRILFNNKLITILIYRIKMKNLNKYKLNK